MKVKLFFNEISLDSWACDISDSKSSADSFVTTLLELTRAGTERSLCHPATLITSKLGSSYTLSKWLDDKSNDKEKARLLKSLLTKSPFFETFNQPSDLGCEAAYEGKYASGLLYSHLYDGISISFLSSDVWDVCHINIEIMTIDESGEIETKLSNVRHVAKVEHITEHEDSIRQSSLSVITDGMSLASYVREQYQGIILCENAISQLHSLQSNDPHLQQISKLILSIYEYLTKWTGGPFDVNELCFSTSAESASTMDKYSEERSFICPDGTKRAFTLHAKINPHAWRIYFFPMLEQQTVFIGYIGKHLSTAKHK